ncbi:MULTISPECIES: THUMP-like domain-containing protein [Bizionia]|uniref:Class I SAM-dependent methyltransferase n=1 Tax=Bizionia algoritergicola TaxID=291187 RepID=A0A5D0QWY3_9FLAO|nr:MULTISPECIES: class I SAM-dependent methyltransferase [Bizionia]OBX21478.1 SAM-dependent methyltransferase [Bizionia sp. APA-3]TYB73727.1 class I SAM-dependent methyltransferase [Bizionia algoritergicola]
MNVAILNTENQEFIDAHLESDSTKLLFGKAPHTSASIKELVAQIEAKKRSKTKLPSWFKTPLIYYPNKLNIEQTSSEDTAQYKASLVSGESLLDITGGFGVDCYYFAKTVQRVIHCEINNSLSEIVTYNFKQLQVTNIQTISEDGIGFLKSQKTGFDWIYIDPSRRHDSKGKVFFLKDCLPSVPDHLDDLFKHTNNLLIKTAPLLDISSGIQELKAVKEIHVVGLNNEVKELLWILENGYEGSIAIKTINLNKNQNQTFNFQLNQETLAQATYSLPKQYLYEPNPAILKSGAFNSVSNQLQLDKLHQHTHLYTSNDLVDFPGRSFEIVGIVPYNKKAVKKLGITQANITTRNFPDAVATIRKKLKIADGGDTYLFFATNMQEERIGIICKKVEYLKA